MRSCVPGTHSRFPAARSYARIARRAFRQRTIAFRRRARTCGPRIRTFRSRMRALQSRIREFRSRARASAGRVLAFLRRARAFRRRSLAFFARAITFRLDDRAFYPRAIASRLEALTPPKRDCAFRLRLHTCCEPADALRKHVLVRKTSLFRCEKTHHIMIRKVSDVSPSFSNSLKTRE